MPPFGILILSENDNKTKARGFAPSNPGWGVGLRVHPLAD